MAVKAKFWVESVANVSSQGGGWQRSIVKLQPSHGTGRVGRPPAHGLELRLEHEPNLLMRPFDFSCLRAPATGPE